MVDQIALAEFTSPAPGVGIGFDWDVTDGSITDPAKAAVLLFSATTSDDTDVPNARAGISLISSESVQKGLNQTVLARDALTAPDCRTASGTGQLVRVPRVSSFPTQWDADNNFDSVIAGGFRLTTVIDPLVQTKGVALLLAGSGMRSWILDLVATTTLQNANTGPITPSDTRFEADLLVVLVKDSSGAGQVDDAVMGLGFVWNDGSATQVCTFTDWDDATEPSDTDGELRDDVGGAGFATGDRATRILVTFGFTSTGITYQANTGNLDVQVLAVKFGEPREIFAGQLEVDGSPAQSFALPFDPVAVVGMVTRLPALNTPDGTNLAGAFGLFAFTPALARAYSARFKQGESVSSGASTRQGDHAVLLLDHVGAVAIQGDYDGTASPHGFVLDFTAASDPGFLTILAFAPVGMIEVEPVELELLIPAPSFAGLTVVDPVELELEVPAPLLVFPQQPIPVQLALVLPAASLLTPVTVSVFIPPVLGPLYAESLASLLPRGLAWPRSGAS